MTALSGFCSCSGAVDLLVFSLYIVNLDKQLYVELRANQYKCLVGLVWRYWGFVLTRVHCIVDLTIGVCLFIIGMLCLLFLAIFGLNFCDRVVGVPFLLGCSRSACFFSLHCKS